MKIVSALFLFVSLHVNAAFEVLRITTNIDISNLYTNGITSVEFLPSVLDVTPTTNKSKFSDSYTKLMIKTDIPKEVVGVGYAVNLTKNSSSCINYSGIESQQDELVTLTLDNQYVTIDNPISIADFTADDGDNKYSEHDIELTFKPFSEFSISSSLERCNGEIEFSVEVDV